MRAAIFSAALLAAVALGLATPTMAGRGQSVNLSLGLTSYYDDNFLEYSDNQLRDFANGAHPLRYSIESTDDGIFEPEVALSWMLDQGQGRRHIVRLRGQGDFHAKNATADFNSASVRWTEAFRRQRRYSAGLYWLNQFYLRQLRDDDLPRALGDYRYQRAEFDLWIASASWRQRLSKTMQGGIGYQYEDRTYNEAFRERSSGTHEIEAWVGWTRLPKRGDLDLHVRYRDSNADGNDGDEVGGLRDDDDVSYHGFGAGVAYRLELARKGSWRYGADLGYAVQARHYDSTVLTDRYHYGRNDLLNSIIVGARAAYRPYWNLRGYYSFAVNSADLSAIAPPTSDSGSYLVNQFGLAIEWSGDIWHQAPPDEEEGGE